MVCAILWRRPSASSFGRARYQAKRWHSRSAGSNAGLQSGRQAYVQGLIYGTDHALQERQGRRSGIHAPRRMADRGGHARLVPVGTTGECPTLSHEEHKHVVELCIKVARKRVPVIAGRGLQLDSRGDRLHAACQEGRCRRRAACDWLLQQADAGRPLSALQGHQRRGRYPDLPLQRAAPHDRRHLGGDHRALRQAEERRRHQGCDRQRVPRHPAAAGVRQRFRPAVRRRCDGPGLQRARRYTVASRSRRTWRRACAPTSRRPA